MGNFLLSRLGDAELAEELTSRVFVTVVRCIDQCRGNEAAWLWAIVRSEMARHLRDRKLHAEADETIADRAAATPADLADARETALRLKSALAQLGDAQQTIIYMKFFQDMRNIDIAAATGLTPANVGVMVHRSLKALRDLLGLGPRTPAGPEAHT